MKQFRETFLMLLLALSLLGCASEGKPVLYGQEPLTTDVDQIDQRFDRLALSVSGKIRAGKPKRYVLKWELIPKP